MSNSELQQRKNDSKSYNEHVLLDIGFCRVSKPSKVFNKKGTGIYILSPGFTKGNNGRYWFDISEANLVEIEQSKKAWVLLRIKPVPIKPGWFALFPFDLIRVLMNPNNRTFRKNNKFFYGFHCNPNEQNQSIEIELRKKKKDLNSSFFVELLDLSNVEQSLAQIEI